MRRLATTTVLLLLVSLGVGSRADAQVTIGIRIGPPPAPRVVRVLPPRPAPSFVWIEGYWYPVGSRYAWHNGYWTRPPYDGAYWVQPRYAGQSGQLAGYWGGTNGPVIHSHGSGSIEGADFGHGRGRGRGR